jgi:hypothetical protein
MFLCAAGASAEFTEVRTGIDLTAAEMPKDPSVGIYFKGLKNGAAYESRLLGKTAESWSLEDSDGCNWSRPPDAMAPATSWKNCNGSSGSATVQSNGGSPWPMKVGTSWSYRVNGGNWQTDRDCEVEDAVRVRIGLGEFDTYKVVCTDRWRTRTRYYAPAIEKVVFSENIHRKRLEREQYELTEQ